MDTKRVVSAVSVVVPTFNRRASLQRLLEGLAVQSYPVASFEVLVVDDGSTDGTHELLSDLALPYQLRIFHQEHQGPAAARNLGVAQAKCPIVVFLDDDVMPGRHLLAEHVATHATASDAVVIGPMSPPESSWPRPAWVRWEENKLQIQYRALVNGKYACTPRQFYTGNASLSRDRFLEAGGFDSSFRRAEDVELGYRLRDRGARFIFNPRADVTHYSWRSFDAWCATPYQYGRYDVAMHSAASGEALEYASSEFHQRHVLTRMLARLCVGRRPLVDLATVALKGVALGGGKLAARRAASAALSGLFNLLYWQGICDEIGDRAVFWRSIGEGASRPFRSAAIPRV